MIQDIAPDWLDNAFVNCAPEEDEPEGCMPGRRRERSGLPAGDRWRPGKRCICSP